MLLLVSVLVEYCCNCAWTALKKKVKKDKVLPSAKKQINMHGPELKLDIPVWTRKLIGILCSIDVILCTL